MILCCGLVLSPYYKVILYYFALINEHMWLTISSDSCSVNTYEIREDNPLIRLGHILLTTVASGVQQLTDVRKTTTPAQTLTNGQNRTAALTN